MKRFLAAALVLAGASLGGTAASAHALLQHAVPAVGSTVAASPSTLTLTFSEGVEAGFCRVAVTAEGGGASFTDGKPANVPGNKRGLVVKLKPLPPGTYAVAWHTVSVDTHHTEGRFTFTVSR